jgi:uncharacterized protein (TIGR03437 family)
MKPRNLQIAFYAFTLPSCFAADLRVGSYQGHRVVFQNVHGKAVYQSDIILGRTDEIEAGLKNLPPAHRAATTPKSVAAADPSLLWPNGVIPFVIDSELPDSQVEAVRDAIKHWNTNTPIQFVERAGRESSYVRFAAGTYDLSCSSYVGRQGGLQDISLPFGCGFREIVHEMGHTVGLWHEQSRSDRNRYLTILYDNIDKLNAYNFDQALWDGQDIGPYDFNSIMHYGAFDFSRDELNPTLETVPPGIPIGESMALSAGDILAVQALYGKAGTKTTIATAPGGLQVKVDGMLVPDGTTFDWTPGEHHTLEAADQGDDQTRYVFALWNDGGAASHSITSGDRGTVFTAAFSRQFKLTPSVSPDASGSVRFDPPSPDGFYTDRSNLLIQAKPAPGYALQDWSVYPSRSLNPKWMTVREPATVTASFNQGNVTTVTSTPVGRLIYVDSEPYSTPANFFWSKGEIHTLDIDTWDPLYERFRFMGWDDGGAQAHTVTSTGEPAAITAAYMPQHSVRMATLGSGDVAFAPASADDFYDEGTVVSLTATPATNNVLLGWWGDVRGNQSPATLTVDEQKLFVALFGNASLQDPFRVVHAATGDQSTIAPGTIVSLYGNGPPIGPAKETGLSLVDGKVSTRAGGVEVLFDGQPAPITYAGPNQINCVVPYAVGKDVTHVRIRRDGQTLFPDADVMVPVANSAPGIFTLSGTGRLGAAASNEDGTLNAPENPAARGSVVVLWATGDGEITPRVGDGTVNTTIFPKPLLPVSVRVGGQPARVEYAGAAPFLVAGAMQINFRIPAVIRAGPKVPVVVVVGDQASAAGVTVAVR